MPACGKVLPVGKFRCLAGAYSLSQLPPCAALRAKQTQLVVPGSKDKFQLDAAAIADSCAAVAEVKTQLDEQAVAQLLKTLDRLRRASRHVACLMRTACAIKRKQGLA
jgi:hypothetical protein